MKWYKHISDSLDDPFIFDLMTEFGSDAYVVFFGVLEIYSREFSAEKNWKLVVSLTFFHQKLRISPKKIKKILSKIHKWETEFDENKVSVFIPKFTELLDEWTARKLGSNSGQTPKKLSHDKDKDKEKDKEKPPFPPLPKKAPTYSQEFVSFWSSYPKKIGKDAAWRAWQSRNGTMPGLPIILEAVQRQAATEQWRRDGGQYIPHPATWINQGRWDDVIQEPEDEMTRWLRESEERRKKHEQNHI